MKEAVREGQSIFSYDPKGKATEAYRRVTEAVSYTHLNGRNREMASQEPEGL